MSDASPIAALRAQYLVGTADPLGVLEDAVARSNSNASHNTYLAQDLAWSRREAAALRHKDIATQPLWGIPLSLKDCFDLAGFPTSCGSAFYREFHGIAARDSAIAARLRAAGAVLTGKTHLHQLAYGITGENRDFGDCLQPAHPERLTGGSSSGAAASLQEGSALAAIGTDTGGSIRVPAALCGLAGYRSSISRNTPELWQGGAHLAPTFDTLGWLYPDLRDGPTLAHALFNLPPSAPQPLASLKFGIPDAAFLHDSEPDVLATLDASEAALRSQGATVQTFTATLWQNAMEIFAPIQASEAAALHRGHFQHFEPAIAERLAWGESIPAADLITLRQRLEAFRAQTAALFDRFDYLLLPCAPTSALPAHADHSQTRARILRYTAPISLCGLPVVTLPGPDGTGLQLVGALHSDPALLAVSTLFHRL